MKRTCIAIAMTMAVLTAVGWPSLGAAQDDYRNLVREALSEVQAGNFQEALVLFQQAYQIRPSARVLRGIANTRFELRQYVECIEATEQALASSVDPLTPDMQREMNELRERASRFVGTLVVRVEPATATLLLDGREVPPERRGQPIRVTMGSHTIEASETGYAPTRRTVDLLGGQTHEATIALDRIAPVITAVVSGNTSTGDTNVTPIGSSDPSDSGGGGPNGALLGAGLGVLGLGVVGVAAGAAWYVDRNEETSFCASPGVTVTCSNQSTLAGERDAALGITITSAFLVAGGAVLTIVAFVAGDGSSSASAMCTPTSDGIMCAGGLRW